MANGENFEVVYHLGPLHVRIPSKIYWPRLQSARSEAEKTWDQHGSNRRLFLDIQKHLRPFVRSYAQRTGQAQAEE